MPYRHEIIVFANSRKPSGRCIAGKIIGDLGVSDWIRPVSARTAGELSEVDRWFENGKDPTLLDVVSVRFLRLREHDYQVENHLIDDESYWVHRRRATMQEIIDSTDNVAGVLWYNGSSSYNGTNDQVPENVAPTVGSTLKLVSVTDLQISVQPEFNGKRKIRGFFNLSNFNYGLTITDPVVERAYLARNDGVYPVGNARLCLSLGELYAGHAYKLIAGVIMV